QQPNQHEQRAEFLKDVQESAVVLTERHGDDIADRVGEKARVDEQRARPRGEVRRAHDRVSALRENPRQLRHVRPPELGDSIPPPRRPGHRFARNENEQGLPPLFAAVPRKGYSESGLTPAHFAWAFWPRVRPEPRRGSGGGRWRRSSRPAGRTLRAGSGRSDA